MLHIIQVFKKVFVYNPSDVCKDDAYGLGGWDVVELPDGNTSKLS